MFKALDFLVEGFEGRVRLRGCGVHAFRDYVGVGVSLGR